MAAPSNVTFDDGMVVSGVDETSAAISVVTAAAGKSITGRGGQQRPVVAAIDRAPLKVVTGVIQFDTSYPTGGEDISAIANRFRRTSLQPSTTARDLRGIIFGMPPTGNRIAVADLPNLKVKLFTALGTEAANASDQSTISVRFIAWGT